MHFSLLGPAAAPAPGFADLLVRLAVCALAGCLGWALLIVAAAVLEAASGGRLRVLRLTGCPPVWRRRLLRLLVPLLAPAVGAGLWAGTPAGASPDPVGGSGSGSLPASPAGQLDGLPLPELPTGPTRSATLHGQSHPGVPGSVVVRRGDTLWAIAAHTLPPGADQQRVARRCAELYRLNRAVVGGDPDLIRPGQRLVLPPTPEEDHR
jgi:nucleoid-associated protein YgaU